MITNSLNKINTLIKANMQVSMTYKINFLVGLFSTSLLIFIHYQLWGKIYYGNNVGMIGDYSYRDMIVYVILIRVSYVFVNSLDFEEKVSREIKDGDLSTYLTKPINYLFYNICSKMGDMILQAAIAIIVLAIFLNFLFSNTQSKISLIFTLVSIVSIFIGLLINTLIGYLFALSAFWFEHISIMFIFKKNLVNFISGVWIPISLFPNAIQAVLKFLPFNYIQYFPVTIFQRKITRNEILFGIIIQLVWLLILVIMCNIVWNKGLKKYTGVGG